MPVRKIGTNYRSLTGRLAFVAEQSIQFESSLERDFLELQRFDPYVVKIEEQPIAIRYVNSDERISRYTPDFLVVREDSALPKMYSTTLYEIKYREELWKNWPLLKRRFQAARDYANSRNWQFKIVTERQIRSVLLWNIKFLRQYEDVDWAAPEARELRNSLEILREATPELLLASVKNRPWNRAELIPFLWSLVRTRTIEADLSRRLTMNSPIWISYGDHANELR